MLSNVKTDRTKKLNVLRDTKFEKTKNELSEFLVEENSIFKKMDYSIIISFILVVLSLVMIFLHFHFYLKNPVNFSQNFTKVQ